MSFRDFIAAVSPRYRFYAHLEPLIDALQRVADGTLKRLMVFMPPRHGKSETVSRLFPAYYLLRHGAHFVGLASYGADLAYTLSRAARDFYGLGGGAMRGDAGAVKHWQTTGGGGLWAAGVGGPMTGKGFHLGVIDDPIKDAIEASSSTTQNNHIEWWHSTFSSRMEPDAAVVIVLTRWNDKDLAGYLLSKEADEPDHWHIINMPALAEEPRTDWPATVTLAPDDRPIGAALCPGRYSVEKLNQIASRNEYYFAALYQQRPRPRDGGLFGSAVDIVLAASPLRNLVRYYDKAGAAPGKGDYTVGVLMGVSEQGVYYVLDVLRFQAKAHDRNDRAREQARLDAAQWGHVRIGVEQPPGLGVEATEGFIRALDGFSVTAEPVRGDKVERAEPYAAQWQAGRIKVVAGAWNAVFFDEHRAFPFGQHDDQVDAAAGAYRMLSGRVVSMARPEKTVQNRWNV